MTKTRLQIMPAVGAVLLLGSTLIGCGNENGESDAYGNFRATEIIISSEVSGRLMQFVVDAGDRLEAGQRVGLIDTVQAALKRTQLEASTRAVRARIAQVQAEIDVLEEQRAVAETERSRVVRLMESNAATQKQLDDVEGQIRVLDRRIRSIGTQNASIRSEIDALSAQIAQVNDQIRRSFVFNPVGGTVLEAYAEPFELTAAGKPLYKIADLDTLILRAYVAGGQLSDLRLGQQVDVLYDVSADELASVPGRISWISAEAEFTPKMVQTREERVSQVYAFEVRVANPTGALKIGMPGEVVFGTASR